jgi:hypothetical protein
MPRARYEPTTQMFKQPEKLTTFNRVSTVTGLFVYCLYLYEWQGLRSKSGRFE